MELQLQQRFGSTSANLGEMANLPPSLFSDQGKQTSTKKAARAAFAGARKRPRSTDSESVHLEFDEVIDHLKRGEHLTPNDAVAAFNLGWAYKRLGRWAESADAFTKAIEFLSQVEDKYRNLNLATTYYMRGYAYASLATKQEGDEARQNFEKAEGDYLEALKLKKDYMLVYCYLGVLYGVQSRWREAERALKNAIKLKPGYSGAHHDLGMIYVQSGKPKLALKAFEKAVKYDPKNLLSLKHLAEAYYEAEQWEEARRILLRVIKLDPEDQDVLYKLGGVYLHFGDFPRAEGVLLKVLELDPDDAVAYGNLGLVYLESERLGAAADAFNQALKLGHPDVKGIRSSLNGVQLEMLKVVVNAYFEILSYGVVLDVDALVAQVAKVREVINVREEVPLEEPGAYFPNQLIILLSPLVEQLDEETRFLLAAKLFERDLLSSGKASELIGLPRATFLLNLHQVGVAMINLSPEDLEEEFRYASVQ